MNAIQGILEKTEATSVTAAPASAAPTPGATGAAPKSAYPPVAGLPTQPTRVDELRFDFNHGARVQILQGGLAWAAGCPVVMISGFTHPSNEFDTPYRVINYHACNSCWNDPRHRFDHKDFMWCPRHAGTPRQFECTRLITANQVCTAIAKLPGFTATAPPPA